MRPITPIIVTLLCALPAFAIPSTSIDTPPSKLWRTFFNRAIRKIAPVNDVSALDHALLKQSPIKENGIMGPLRARYGNDIVLRFNISTAEEAVAIQEASDTLFLDIWEFHENWADIRLAKNMLHSFLGLLPRSLQHAHAPLMHDMSLVEAIAETVPYAKPITPDHHRSGFSAKLSTAKSENSIFFNDYQPLSVIEPWMQLLASYYPTHVRLLNIGTSYEGRKIPAMRLGVHPTNNERPLGPRKTIVISGGLHAREWISTSTVNYVAFSLITSYGKSATINSLLEQFDWVFIPTLNPDGYVFTWETDRLWRKNRQPTNLRFCNGLDLDRSFGFHWDGEMTKGNPCSESFAGENPFEAVEAKAFSNWAKNETQGNNTEFIALLDLHSYSQQVLYPYSFSCENDPPSLENLEELALGLAKAMRLSHGGQVYKATSACEGNVAIVNGKKNKTILPRLEAGGGSLLDWFYNELSVKYAFQIKLRDTGNYGFLLPKENIVPTGKEVLEAIQYLGRFLTGSVGLEENHTSAPQKTNAAQESPATDLAKTEAKNAGQSSANANDEEDSQQQLFELRRRRR